MNRLDKCLSGIVLSMGGCCEWLHEVPPIPNLPGFLISPSDDRWVDDIGLILETYNHGIWDPGSEKPQRKYMCFSAPVFRFPRELIGYGCCRGSKLYLALVLGFWLINLVVLVCGVFLFFGWFFLSASLTCLIVFRLFEVSYSGSAKADHSSGWFTVGVKFENFYVWIGKMGCYWQALKWQSTSWDAGFVLSPWLEGLQEVALK